ncbi:MAG: hypothetical protein GY750_00955, partial [Lentisphaerae bacterium]|nr:hypothetical protein [Lentisphaerota bacterium]
MMNHKKILALIVLIFNGVFLATSTASAQDYRSLISGVTLDSSFAERFILTLNVPGVMVIRTSTYEDTILSLYDANGNCLSMNDDYYANNYDEPRASRITHSAPAGTYYVEVSGFYGNPIIYSITADFENTGGDSNGTDGDDVLNGTDGDDVINGYYGVDEINGSKGNDVLNGGNGGDKIHGGEGNDVLISGDGGNYNGVHIS